jgi:hypothetical protein
MLANDINALRFIENSQFIVFPEGDRTMRFHRVVMLHRNRIDGFDFDRCGFECFSRFPARFQCASRGIKCFVQRIFHTRHRLFFVVRCLHETCGIAGLFECFRQDESDRLHIKRILLDCSAGNGLKMRSALVAGSSPQNALAASFG